MSEVFDALLVDVGNTRLKVSLFNKGAAELNISSVESLDALKPLMEQCHKVLVSCVGEKKLVQSLARQCEQMNKSLFVAQTQAEQFGVHCAYKNYQTLGVDRWLAILAARSITSLPVAVLDLGTAATCDVIKGDQHIGGWIAPGFELMRAALISNTQQVFGNDERPESLVFANSTEACVNMGCLSAIQGMLLNAKRLLSAKHDEYRIIVCGGDNAMLGELFEPAMQIEENLVLRGLSLFV